MKRKIIVNARFLTQKPSGVQRFAIEISSRLKNNKNLDIEFVCPSHIHPINTEIAKQLDVKVIGFTNSHIWEQIELPLYYYFNKNALLVNLCTTAPFFVKQQIVTIHDIIFLIFPEWYSYLIRVFYNILLPFIAKKSKLVITVSKSAKSDLVKYLNLNEQKVEVVPNAVADYFFASTNELVEYEHTLPEKYILIVGNLDPRKNINRCILAYLNSTLPDSNIYLLVIGKKSKTFSEAVDKKILANTDKIHFKGFVSNHELKISYRKALFFVYASLYEGFGIPPLEAMACNCPCIVSNTSSMPEVCGDAVAYVDPTSQDQITECMNKLANNEDFRMALIEKGIERYKLYNWDESALKMTYIIENNL